MRRQVACIYLTWVGLATRHLRLPANLRHTLPPPAAGAGARGAARRRADGGSWHHHSPTRAGVSAHCPGQFGSRRCCCSILLPVHSALCSVATQQQRYITQCVSNGCPAVYGGTGGRLVHGHACSNPENNINRDGMVALREEKTCSNRWGGGGWVDGGVGGGDQIGRRKLAGALVS